MPSKLKAFFFSPVGQKLWTAITGLSLVLFVLVHMIGNLGYFGSEGAYNKYADFLINGTGPLIYVIEAGLLAFFLFHVVLGVAIWIGKKKARPQGYRKYQSRGGSSRQSLSSRSMIATGIILLVFTVIHLFTFKFGPSIEDGYIADPETGVTLSVTDIPDDLVTDVGIAGGEIGPDEYAILGGERVVIRDLRRLVTETFQSPLYAFGYAFVMLLLAFHLRHGIWSAFQSLGAINPKISPIIYAVGGFVGALIAIGFVVLPLYIFFTGG
jgi:succinate dehydrogenase / fumarate reductase cytochrome b subunit